MTPMKDLPCLWGIDRHGVSGQTVAHRFDGVLESAPVLSILLMTRAADVIFVRLAPNRFRLRLHATRRVKNRHRAVQDAQRALDFHGESTWPGVSMILIENLCRCASRMPWSRRT